MKRTLLALALVAASTVGVAQGTGYGPGAGGYGPGPGYGAGTGPGMMGYGGPGYGGGPAYGPRAGRGAGPGGLSTIADLTEDQREKIAAIQEEYRRKNWDTLGQIRSEEFKLRRIYSAEPLDPTALADQQRKVDDLRRQMVKSHAEQHNQIVAALTPEQRKKVRQFGPWWSREGYEE